MASGGKREGSGRKRVENKRIQMVITIDPETRTRLREIAKSEGITPGRVIDRIIDKR